MIYNRQEKVLIHQIWSSEIYSDVYSALKVLDVNKLEINSIQENHLLTLESFGSPDGFPSGFLKILDLCSKKNIQVDLILASAHVDTFNESKTKLYNTLPAFVTIKTFPYAFIRDTFDKTYSYKQAVPYKFMFSCLVNRPKLHRCMFVDKLHEFNLETKTFLTWNTTQEEEFGPLFTGKYNFKFWKEKQIKHDVGFARDKVYEYQYNKLPLDYYASFFDLVLESFYDDVFITEKTWKPIFLKKPFLVVGGKNFHKKLQDMGFLLYDNIIDYSFDQEDDLEKRINKLGEQIFNLSELDINYLKRETEEITNLNYESFIELEDNLKRIFHTLNTSETLRNLFNKNMWML